MVTPATKRVKKYKAKFDPQVISQRFEAVRDIASEEVEQKFNELENIENQVEQILHAHNVPSILKPFYLAYARQLYKITKKHDSDTAKNEAFAKAIVWKLRGLQWAILKEIAGLFNIDIGNEPTISSGTSGGTGG